MLGQEITQKSLNFLSALIDVIFSLKSTIDGKVFPYESNHDFPHILVGGTTL